MGHIIAKDKGGSDDPSNLRAVCTNCNEGLSNAAAPTPDRRALMKTIRRAKNDDQLYALEWLQIKFGKYLAAHGAGGTTQGAVVLQAKPPAAKP